MSFDDFIAQYDFGLDDYQLDACKALQDGSGVLLAAPTGAGKTVVGEFAVWLAIQEGRKCFYTTPIKALSNQKYHDLIERWGSDRVGLLTGDQVVNSDAQIVVMTTEVLRNMIYASSSTLNNLGYVVLDEVHYLADRFRGAVWEEVILGLAPLVQIVALSATVSNVEEFGDWLAEVRGNISVVVSERRPVPLFQHVMFDRKIFPLFARIKETKQDLKNRPKVNPELLKLSRVEAGIVRDDARRPRGRSSKGKRHHNYGSGSYGGAAHEKFRRKRPATTRRDMIWSLKKAEMLPGICFIFSRQGCDHAVRQVSDIQLTTRSERAELAAIADRQVASFSNADLEVLGYEEFRAALLNGVAAHHAGLLPTFKAIVEESFVSGALKMVFATETLALGINMPARTVVLEKLVKYNGETHADITPGEYTQLTGRAGRRGIDIEGHAVVLWQPGMDPRALAGLASKRTYPLRSSFTPTYNMAVNLVSSQGKDR
ncbi:MAG: RNA helicase, partial [Actinomycetales bacterium]